MLHFPDTPAFLVQHEVVDDAADGQLRIVLDWIILEVFVAAVPVPAQQREAPAEFRGDWVPAAGGCDSKLRFRVLADRFVLTNGTETQEYGDIAWPSSYFGPDYTGISAVAIAEFEGDQPFTAYFNVDEKPGVTRLDILQGPDQPGNVALNAIVKAGKALNARFPLHQVALKKCPG